ncbi:MAG: CooT family nickel-binding protein [Syntrophorhabdaceae bacterium]|nr:CooT family nickel-binding protein [Syntrophorhabdaceae bacterium]
MCLAKVFMEGDNVNELLLNNVVSLEVSEKDVTLTTLLEERRTFEAKISSIDFLRGSIILKKHKGSS